MEEGLLYKYDDPFILPKFIGFSKSPHNPAYVNESAINIKSNPSNLSISYIRFVIQDILFLYGTLYRI